MPIRTIDTTLLDSYSEDIPHFLKRIYAARGIKEDELNLSINSLHQPNFKNLDKAIERLITALLAQQRILIVGDFDADGATACALALKALRLMGAQYVDFLVPNRFEHGYGLSPEIVALAKADKEPDLIITVDNGISSFSGVELANQNGIDVIVTDHHLPSDTLPDACAIINPNLKDCKFPSKNLAGVGVCFYLFSALKTALVKQGYFRKYAISEPNFAALLDLVAVGTIADVVKLDRNNRILVNEGLKCIQKKRCSMGIIALFEVAKRSIHQAKANDIAFSIAPRLNAAGRMSDISCGIRCLLSDEITLARQYAQELEQLNQQRRQQQALMQQQAEAITINQPLPDYGICLYDNNWHEGIVGIVAGRLKEKYQRPVCVLANSDNGLLKGSIRSISDVHIKDMLDKMNSDYPDVIEKFGGHAMAAGLVINRQSLHAFMALFDQAVKQWLNGEKPRCEITTDGVLDESEISFKNAQLINQTGPWGQGFEQPIFEDDFEIVEQTVIAEKHLRLYLKKKTANAEIFNAIAFNQPAFVDKVVRLNYQLSVNDYRGSQSLQLIICN